MTKNIIIREIEVSLHEASSFFNKMGYVEWESEVQNALEKLKSEDYSFVESMWLRYAPTCAIDELIITNYKPEDEDKVNRHNEELAKISNRLFNQLENL